MSSVTGQAHGIGAAHTSARSAPLYTATTPGSSVAAAVSTPTIRAWAYGLRTTAQVQGARDVEIVGELGLAREQGGIFPAQPALADDRRGCGFGGRHRSAPAHASAAARTALDDVVVPGAAAEVALQPDAHLPLASGSGFSSSKLVAAITMPGVQYPHCRPWFSMNACCIGCNCPSVGQPLDGRDVRSVGLDRQHGAALRRTRRPGARCRSRTTTCRSRRSCPSARPVLGCSRRAAFAARRHGCASSR